MCEEFAVRVDPVTGLRCRSDGAVYYPGSARHSAGWDYGCAHPTGYRVIYFRHCLHLVHRLICRAFCGEPPAGKPFVDHRNRVRSDNRAENLQWATAKENRDNTADVEALLAQGRVRSCVDRRQYCRDRYASSPNKVRACARERAAARRAAGYRYTKGPDGKHHWVKAKTLTNKLNEEIV